MSNVLTYSGRTIVENLDSSTLAWLGQLTVRPSANYINNINSLIVGLKSAGIWSNLDRMWIFATEQRQHATISIVNPSGDTAVWPVSLIESSTAVTWTTLSGYTNLSGVVNLNTQYSAKTQGTNYLQNSASIGMYVTNLAAGNISTGLNMGATAGAGVGAILQISQGGANIQLYINTTQTTNVPTSLTKSNGFSTAVRSSSTLTSQYSNGKLVATTGTTSVANDIPTFPMFIGSFNNAGTGQGGLTTMYYSMAFIGGANINQLVFYTLFQQFASAIGFSV